MSLFHSINPSDSPNEGRDKINSNFDFFSKEMMFSAATLYWAPGSSGAFSIVTINDSDTDSKGDYSVSEGYNTTAYGFSTHSEGAFSKSGIAAFNADSIIKGLITLNSSYGDVSGNYSSSDLIYLNDFYGDNNFGSTIQQVSGSTYNGTNTLLQLSPNLNSPNLNTGNLVIYNISNQNEGDVNFGEASHSEGGYSISIGVASHAEGGGSVASGNFSHAEGNTNLSIGDSSHAEGFGSQAIGDTSHAEGNSTKSIGISSHAEGAATQAVGDNSHAEGNSTKSIGISSHAEGATLSKRSTLIAGGKASHAEGANTHSYGDYSHSENIGGYSAGIGSHNEGNETIAGISIFYNISSMLDNYTILVPYDMTSFFLSGDIILLYDQVGEGLGDGLYRHYSQVVITGATFGEGSTVINISPTSVIWDYTNVTKILNLSRGINNFSHAEGYTTKAIGGYSHAGGINTLSFGTASHTEGDSTQSGVLAVHADSIINGLITISSGYGDISGSFHNGDHLYLSDYYQDDNIGTSLQLVSSTGAIYNGTNTQIQLNVTNNSLNSYDGLYIFNLSNQINGDYLIGYSSHAEGTNTIAIGDYSHSEGKGNVAAGFASHAGGGSTNAIGDFSHTEGDSTKAVGYASHSEGLYTKSIGNHSHAEGNNSVANGIVSHAEGDSTISGVLSFGADSIINGVLTINSSYGDISGSFSPGNTLYLSDFYFNNNFGTTFQSINSSGATYNGTNTLIYITETKGNLNTFGSLSVYNISNPTDGNDIIGYSSHAEGNNTLTLGDYSHAEGVGNVAAGFASHAGGGSTYAIGDFSNTEGDTTTASGHASHSEGLYTKSIGIASHASGSGTTAIGDYSHSEGISTKSGMLCFSADSVVNGLITMNSYYGDISANYSPNDRLFLTFDIYEYECSYNQYIHLSGATYNGTNTLIQLNITDSSLNFTGSLFVYNLTNEIDGDVPMGNFSHAEGFLSQTFGEGSHAEGLFTFAFGIAAHSEGIYTFTDGVASHAEGLFTFASGFSSHAEGISTQTNNDASHAGGNSTTANGLNSFVHGSGSTVNGANSVVLGGINIVGNADNTVYVPDLVIKKFAAIPSGSTDTVGEDGSVTWDSNNFYWKASGQWLMISGSTFTYNLATVTTASVTSAYYNHATTGGDVTSDGGSSVTAYGVVWSLSPNPTLSDSFTVDGSGTGSFVSTITGLTEYSTNYYTRAYATNSAGTAYGDQQIFQLVPCLAEGTKIRMSNNTLKNIEDVNYEDKLLVWNFYEGRFDESSPLWIKKPESTNTYNKLTFSDGTVLKTIGQHRIFNIEKGEFTYPMTDNTPIGTTTFNSNNEKITLVSKEVVNENVNFYNIMTEGNINMFAENILTSSRYSNIYPVIDMKYVKNNRKLRTREEFSNVSDKFYYGLNLSEQILSVKDIESSVKMLERTEIKFELVS